MTTTATAIHPDLRWLVDAASEVARIIGAQGAFLGAFIPGWQCLHPGADLASRWPADLAAANAVARHLRCYMRGRSDSMGARASIYWDPAGLTLPVAGAQPSWEGGLALIAAVARNDGLLTVPDVRDRLITGPGRAWEHGARRADALAEFIRDGLRLAAHWRLDAGGTQEDATSLVAGIALRLQGGIS